MKELSSEEQRRRANLFWKNITDEQYSEFSNKMKEYWTDEKREQKSIDMIKFYENPENIARKCEESKQVWESRSEEFKVKFRNKMDDINKNEEKRKDAGEKIKNIWKTEEYLNKMKSRKHRDGNKLKLIDTEGNEFVFETIKKFSETYNFSPHFIRKYRDKKIEISEIHLDESNIILKGCRIESVK
jgi:hypothetical protein